MQEMPFNSERWDVNKLIDDETNSDAIRLRSLILLWQGRANDIKDQNRSLGPVQQIQIDTYEHCCFELKKVLLRLYPEEMV